MAVTFDLGMVLKYYTYVREKGEATRGLQKAMDEFNIEEAIKKAEKVAGSEDVFVVPCLTGKGRKIEIEGIVFVEVC